MTLPDDTNAMLTALTSAFPGLGDIDRIGDGFSAVVFRSARGRVFRVARTPRAAERHTLLLSVLPRLAPSLPIPIPIPDAILPPSPALPHGALTYPGLRGTMAIPERLTEPMANQLADALAALHAVDPAGFPELPREHDDAWVALRAAVEPACRALLSPVEVGTIAAWWERFLAAPERRRYRPAICHGDLWHENLLLDAGENRLCGILDWENFTVGDPAQDLAYLRHAGDAFADAVFARYVERAGARADDALARRVQWFWEAREFDGLRLAIDLRDEEEMMDTVGKLRRGPILAPPGQATTS